MNSELSDIPKQGMQIVHEVRIELAAETTSENVKSSEPLVAAADKSRMVGNLLKTAGVQISVSGTVKIATHE